MIPFAIYAPDRSSIDPNASDTIKNVLPRVGSYGPMPSFAPFTLALPARPQGAFVARAIGGVLHTFAGTATGLYKLNTATLAWDNVSGPAAPYSVVADDTWSFVQFGNFVIATNDDDPPQYYEIGVSAAFANLAGSPPQAAYAAVLGDFVILAAISTDDKRMVWSGLNDPTWWTANRKSSDIQIFPDGGAITGVVGWEKGAVVIQEYKMRDMIPDLGGAIFQFQTTDESKGSIAPGSIIVAGRRVFFLSQDGFYQYGTPSTPIGTEVVDRFFIDNCDPAFLHLVQGADDPINKVCWWRFKSKTAVTSTVTDKILGYDYGLDRWFLVEQNLTWMMSASTPGYTLDNLDALGYTIDTLPYSLDSRAWMAGAPVIAGFDSSFKLGFFSGPNMEATVETMDAELVPSRRALVTGFRPVGDAASPYGAVAVKPTHGGTRTWKSEAATNRTGIVPARAAGRLHRFRVRIPAGATWQHVHGVEPDVVPEGIQ